MLLKKEFQQPFLLSILFSSFSGSINPPDQTVFPVTVCWCYSLCSRFCTVINLLSWRKFVVLREKKRIRAPQKWPLHRQARMSIGRTFLMEINRVIERPHQWETKESQIKFWIIGLLGNWIFCSFGVFFIGVSKQIGLLSWGKLPQHGHTSTIKLQLESRQGIDP